MTNKELLASLREEQCCSPVSMVGFQMMDPTHIDCA